MEINFNSKQLPLSSLELAAAIGIKGTVDSKSIDSFYFHDDCLESSKVKSFVVTPYEGKNIIIVKPVNCGENIVIGTNFVLLSKMAIKKIADAKNMVEEEPQTSFQPDYRRRNNFDNHRNNNRRQDSGLRNFARAK